MTRQDQADQGWGPERCLWKWLKRSDFPDFWFSRRAEIGVLPCQKTAFGKTVRKTCISEVKNWQPVIDCLASESQSGNPGSNAYGFLDHTGFQTNEVQPGLADKSFRQKSARDTVKRILQNRVPP
jgi:hypothetical protein